MKREKKAGLICGLLFAMIGLLGCGEKGQKELILTNVSYDPTRELYERYNEQFQKQYEKEHNEKIRIVQSHGGSGSQARSVIEGSNADVVTLALEHDISLIEKMEMIKEGWIKEFPKDASPYQSTIVFLVRKGNPKKIKDWPDLIRDGVEVITPDPKSSGGACWNFLAAYDYARRTYSNKKDQIDFVKRLYENVVVMDSGARGSTTTFVENGQGDVLIAWENEAIATTREYPKDYELISPSSSILAQPSVAVVDENAEFNHTQNCAKEYLEGLYKEDAQRIIAECGYRPCDEKIQKEYADVFDLNMELCDIQSFGGWEHVYKEFFEDGQLFDQIYEN